MTLVQDTISGFIGGISQQPDKLMFPNQAKELINYNPDPITGLIKRKPTQHIKKLMNALTVYPQTYTVIKENERFTVYLTGSEIKVFDLEGNEKQVHYGNVYEVKKDDTIGYTSVRGLKDDYCKEDTKIYSDYQLTTELEEYTPTEFIYTWNPVTEIKQELINYITSTEPLKDLLMTNIGDYTFILNKTVTAKLKDELYPNPHPASALLFVKQGDYSIDYTVYINNKEVATLTTSDTNKIDLKTNSIAQKLYDQLIEKLGTEEWKFTKLNSTILITRLDGTDFQIRTSDSNSDRNLFSFYKETETLTNLPVVAPNGFIIKITGDDGDTSDDYYVQFNTTDNSTFGTGVWKECCSPDMQYRVDSSTMPHALTREADGEFCFKQITWTDRKAGDEDTAKTPSIFGNKISEVFTHKGRLAFLAGDKSIYSDVDDIFSLFKRTVMTKLDTDPIDVGSNSKMVLLKHSLPFNSDLLLFSPSAIFTISGGDVFSNSTVTIDLTMEYPCSSYCKPISLGGSGLFVYDNGKYSGVYEIYTASTYTTAARCVTEQVPCFLPSNIFKMTGSTRNNLMCLISTETPDTIYVYNYYYNSEEKIQSAWHKWIFNKTKILNIDFVDNYLYLTTQYEDGIYYEKLNITPKEKEDNLDFLVHLDRKVFLNGTYNNETNITTYNIPYPIYNEINIIDPLTGFLLAYEFDNEKQIISIVGNYPEIIFGNIYLSQWRLGTIYQRLQGSNGGIRVNEGLLMLADIQLTYLDSCDFKAIITPKYTSQITSEYPFTGSILGTISATLGKIIPHSDTFLIPIAAKNEDVSIDIINNSYLPCCFSSLVWIGDFNVRGK